MSVYHTLVHLFYKAMVYTVLLPLRNQAFEKTRKAKISDTEKEALASGSVGFEGELLKGYPDWQKIMDMPPPRLTEEEQAFLDGPVETLCAMLDDWYIRQEAGDMPPEVWDYMKKIGIFGMIIPKEYGGLGFSALAHSEVILKLSTRSTTACVTAMVPNSLGPAELLVRYGTDEQKNYYLPRLARGQEVPSFALTEPNAGSDASGMLARGVVCKENGELGIRLNWEKRYITLGPVSTLLGVAFKLYDPDGLLGDKKELGITLALVPAETPGVHIGRRHNPLGVPFQVGPTYGKDVWIPLKQIIGGKAYAGKGWRMLMECLSVGRCVSLPALSTGSAKMVCRISGAYSRVRRQFKIPVGKFEGVEELLARMAGTTYLMDAARLATLQMLDRGEHPAILSAVMKYHTTERARQIVNDGMDLLGGKAICEGPSNLISPLYHGIPIGITVEGANLLTRNMIIFGQASVRSHRYILKEMEAARLDDIREARREFSDLMARHVRHSVENTIRSFVYGVFDGGFSPVPRCSRHQKRYYQQINRLSAAFATIADMTLMLLGDSVKRKERISALLGDTMSYLFLASCALRHFTVSGHGEEHLPLLHWTCQQMLYQVEESLHRLLQNFPNRWMAMFLYMVAFPHGRRFYPPSHRLERQVAKTLFNPGTLREQLTQGIYIPREEHEPLAQLEKAFSLAVSSEPLEARILEAKRSGLLTERSPEALLKEALSKNVISPGEAETLKQAEQYRRMVIEVDDFDQTLHATAQDTLALANGKTLVEVYPTGTRWHIEIPRMTLGRLWEEAVQNHGKNPCIDFLGKKYTYHEIDTLITRCAAGLQAMGVGKGTKIGLYMPNTPYYPILFYAAMRVGAVVVNFCPMHTSDELRQQAKDSDTRIMVTLDLRDLYDKCEVLLGEGTLHKLVYCRMEDALPFFKAQAYRIIRSAQIARPNEREKEGTQSDVTASDILSFRDLISTPTRLHPVEIDPDDLAVLQYTGGTTGSPKGAMLTHQNLVANVFQMEEYFKDSADKPDSRALLKTGRERVLVSIPFFHVFGMTVSLLMFMKQGHELLILPDPRNIKETLKTLQEKKPTVFPAVPRLLQVICENPKARSLDYSYLETVISGGAALPPGLKSSFEAVTKKSGLIKQGYGLTEAAPVVSSNPAYGLNKPESVGLPIPMTQVKITDPQNPDHILKLGEVGEICVNGPQLMQGYYNQPEETQTVIHNGWLRTGDLGYLDENYYLHIVDRKKRLIIVNGFNVYPTQIEQAISKHPAVAECIVISVPDARSGEAAKAFIRLKGNVSDKPSVKQMQDFLSEKLSRIELPKHIEFVSEELPKTAVGKPDWRALEERERQKYEENGKVSPLYDDVNMEQAL